MIRAPLPARPDSAEWTVSGTDYRPARLDDAGEIHELLLRLAPEIPLLVDTLEREEALYALVRNCIRSGESWVACDGPGISSASSSSSRTSSAAITPSMRCSICAMPPSPPSTGRAALPAALIGRVTGRLQPVAARVGAQNRTGLATLLRDLGFRADRRGRRRAGLALGPRRPSMIRQRTPPRRRERC